MLGICTFEDVIEALLNKTIADEFDMHGVRLDLKRAGVVMRRVARLKKLAALSRAHVSLDEVSEASGSPVRRARTVSSIMRDGGASATAGASMASSADNDGYGAVGDTTALLDKQE
jgi:hypothetical protein